jgi:hypothetical protein
MSGPGGPATTSTTMTPPSSGAMPPAEIKRIKDNLYKILTQGGTEADADEYLKVEGVTADQIKNSPVARTGQATGVTVVDEARAYNPTTAERMRDLAINRQKGTKAPALPNDAPIWQRAMDWMETFGAGVDTAARGMTFGLTDEAAGAGRAAGAALKGEDAGKAFQEGSAAVNSRIANFKEANPLLGFGLEGIGMVTSPINRVGAPWQSSAPSMAGRAWRAGTIGAGQGALTSAAYNEGDIADRGEAALWGGTLGFGLSAALTPALEIGTRGAQTFMDTLNARRAAANDPAQRARDMIAAAVARDQMTPTPQQGEALVSAGGPNMQALGRTATVAPGNARAQAAQYFGDAAADMPEAIANATRTNVSGSAYLPALDDFTRQQETVASPLYTQAYSANQSMASKELDLILATPEGKKALRKAATMMLNDRSRIGIPDKELTEIVRDLVAAGKMNAPSTGAGVAAGLKLRGLDYVKRALDGEYERLAAAGAKTEAGIILGLKKDLVKELDRLDVTAVTGPNSTAAAGGDYAKARAAFAGPAQMKKAADWGSKVLNDSGFTDEKLRFFSEMSPAEQDAARIGLARNVIEKAGRMGPNTDPVNLFLKGRNASDLMRTMLSNPQAFDQFVATLQQQSRIVKASRAVMGGSPTAPRIAENADAAAQEAALVNQLSMARDAWNLATGGGGGRLNAATNLMTRARNKATGVSEPVADELGRLLFNPNPAANLATVRGVSAQVPQIQANQAAQEWLRRNIGSYGTLPVVPLAAGIGAY